MKQKNCWETEKENKLFKESKQERQKGKERTKDQVLGFWEENLT